MRNVQNSEQIQVQNQEIVNDQIQKIYTANKFLAFTQPLRNYTDMIENIQDYYKVLILSARGHADHRENILKTWGQKFKKQIYFVVGKPCLIPEKYRQVEKLKSILKF